MAEVRLIDAGCQYPNTTEPAVTGIDLEVADGELLVVFGPPESGKSTVLRLVAGLAPLTSGRILVGGHDLADGGAGERGVGPAAGLDGTPEVAMVFQNYALYPHLTVAQNIGATLRLSGTGKKTAKRRVKEAADLLGLVDLLKTKADGLSVGQRIRVALARGLVRRPAVMLMDEPLANLQPGVRAEIVDLLLTAQPLHGVTTLFASADIEESLAMADRIAVLEEGRLADVVLPDQVRAASDGRRKQAVLPGGRPERG